MSGGKGAAAAGRRAGGRQNRAAKRANAATKSFDRAWRQWVNPYAPVEQFSADEIEAIHQASLKVLRDTGINVHNQEARQLYKSAGHEVSDDDIVYLDPDLLLEHIATAPSIV